MVSNLKGNPDMIARVAAISTLILGLAACNQPAPAAGAEPSAPGATAPAAPSGPVLTPKGLGPVLIGMTDAEVRAAAGAANIEPNDGPDVTEGCSQIRLQGPYAGAILMVEEGKLTRITLGEGATLTTDKGIGVGATPAEVLAAYPGAKAEPHKYEDAPAQYLTVWTVPDKEGTVFEVSGSGRVANIHAGGPSIQYVEGCA